VEILHDAAWIYIGPVLDDLEAYAGLITGPMLPSSKVEFNRKLIAKS
jgi:hypothetical protein